MPEQTPQQTSTPTPQAAEPQGTVTSYNPEPPLEQPPVPPSGGGLNKKILVGVILVFVLLAAVAVYAVRFMPQGGQKTSEVTREYQNPFDTTIANPFTAEVANPFGGQTQAANPFNLESDRAYQNPFEALR